MLIFILGIIQLIMLIIALLVIGFNKEMTTIGRVMRAILIVIFPIVGPFYVVIQVLQWRVKKEQQLENQI